MITLEHEVSFVSLLYYVTTAAVACSWSLFFLICPTMIVYCTLEPSIYEMFEPNSLPHCLNYYIFYIKQFIKWAYCYLCAAVLHGVRERVKIRNF